MDKTSLLASALTVAADGANTALYLAMTESIARQAGIDMAYAEELRARVLQNHLGDAVSVRTAIDIIDEAVALA